MDKIKTGIIGTNFISDMFAEAANITGRYDITAVLAHSPLKGEDFAKKNSLTCRCFTDFDEFAQSGIEAVYIATPNCTHCDFTVKSLKRGLNVLCEKPVTSDLDEFLLVKEEALKNKKVFLEAMRPNFDPAYDAIRDNIDNLGPLRLVRMEYCQYSSRYDRFKQGEVLRAFDPSYSNAAIMDIGVYPVFMCMRLFGYPDEIVSSSSILLRNGFEGSGEILLRYGDMHAEISYAKIFDSVCDSIISGENGTITIDKISSPSLIKLKTKEGEKILFDKPVPNNMIYELEAFYSLCEKNEYNNEHLVYSENEMRFIDEIRQRNGIKFKNA